LWSKYARWRFGNTARHFEFQRNVYSAKAFSTLLKQMGFEICVKPEFFEVPPLDKRHYLAPLSRSSMLGTLGLVTARPETHSNVSSAMRF
jgi:hypothetical protein